MPPVTPLPADHSPEVARVAQFFNETLGFPPNSVLTMQRRPEIVKAFTHLNRAVMENGGRVACPPQKCPPPRHAPLGGLKADRRGTMNAWSPSPGLHCA
jgi:hypothetical protein